MFEVFVAGLGVAVVDLVKHVAGHGVGVGVADRGHRAAAAAPPQAAQGIGQGRRVPAEFIGELVFQAVAQHVQEACLARQFVKHPRGLDKAQRALRVDGLPGVVGRAVAFHGSDIGLVIVGQAACGGGQQGFVAGDGAVKRGGGDTPTAAKAVILDARAVGGRPQIGDFPLGIFCRLDAQQHVTYKVQPLGMGGIEKTLLVAIGVEDIEQGLADEIGRVARLGHVGLPPACGVPTVVVIGVEGQAVGRVEAVLDDVIDAPQGLLAHGLILQSACGEQHGRGHLDAACPGDRGQGLALGRFAVLHPHTCGIVVDLGDEPVTVDGGGDIAHGVGQGGQLAGGGVAIAVDGADDGVDATLVIATAGIEIEIAF